MAGSDASATIPGATHPSNAQGSTALAGGTLVEIAVTTPAPGLYHYRIPPHLGGRAFVGSRVLVRFGAKRQTGVIVRAGTPAPVDVAPLDVSEVLDTEPSLSPELVELCLWIANYYEAPPGEVLKGALPAGSGVTARMLYVATTTGEKAIEGEGGALPPKQRAMLAKIVDEELPSTGLTTAQRTAVDGLVGAGLVELRDERSTSTRLRREKWVRVVGDLAEARAKVKRGPKRIAVMDALVAMMRGEEAPDTASDVHASDNPDGEQLANVPVAASAGVSAETSAREPDAASGVPAGTSDKPHNAIAGDVPAGTSDINARNVSAETAVDEPELVRDEVPLEDLAMRVDGAKPVVRELVKAGVVEVFEREAVLEAVPIEQGMSVSAPHELTAEQAHAVAEIVGALKHHAASETRPHDAHVGAVGSARGEANAAAKARSALRPFLLFGVTGSGKTEVYLRVIHEALALGKTALVLVPEISLTPQLAARFRARFGDSVAILHSGLSEQARLGEWSRLRRGDARIAVGARSAVFAPLGNIGVIVVDEEHDGSFKQDEGVKYHGRDVALVRAQRAGAVCVLGSGTPSLESNALAERGAYEKLVLTQRPKARPMPSVDIIDLRLWQPDGESFLAAPLREAVEQTLAAGDQVILFLNRRGFATFIVCVSCGHAFRCPNCSVSLTYHRHGERLTCHYCNYSEGVPTACPKCNSTKIERKGLGTEKIAAALAEQFPSARLARLDRDVASGARAEAVLGRVARREVDLLVGTQMVTKGHDFPGVTLVGVLCADTGLNLPDFRASERTFQLLAQVAGRAGRGDKAGKVLIQTYRPEAPAVVAAALHDYERFYAAEVEERREMHYPPHGRLIVVRVDGPDEHEVAGVAHKIAMSCDGAVRGMLRQRAAKLLEEAQGGAVASGSDDFALEILGPTAAPLARLRGRSRWQIWVRGTDRASIRWVAKHALTIDHASRVRVSLDVDPNSAL